MTRGIQRHLGITLVGLVASMCMVIQCGEPRSDAALPRPEAVEAESAPEPDAGSAGRFSEADLVNLVPYTVPAAAWSDRHSTIALTWTRPQETGLQRLHLLTGWGGAKITDHLLGWTVREAKERIDLELESRVFRPDKVIEKDVGGGIELVVTASYPLRNALAVEIELHNASPRVRELEIAFEFPGKAVNPDWAGPFPVGELVSIDGEPTGSWSTIYRHREHGRNFLWVSGFVAGATDDTTYELVCLADSSPRKIKVESLGRRSLVVPLAFGPFRGQARERFAELRAKLERGWTSRLETERWLDALQRLPTLPRKYQSDPKLRRLYLHAAAGLTSLFVRGDGGYTGANRIPWSAKSGIALAFFWDTAFTCLGAREIDPALCEEAISAFVDNPTPRGSLPGTLCDTHRAGEGQAPIMAFAAWNVYRTGGNKKWLASVYPGLRGYIEFWLKYHTSPRGLGQYFNAGQIADNDARFDPIQRGKSNRDLSGFESPDVNAFLIMEMKCLSELAAELGRDGEAAIWRRRASELAQRVVELTFFEEDAMFFDVKEGTRDKLTGVKSPNLFLPLWAGVRLPENQVKRIVEGHMLNPQEFFGPRPFPSLSYDDPRHDPAGYWRGRIWPHMVYWMIQTLWRHGFHEQAEQTADRLLGMLLESPFLHENYGGEQRIRPGHAEYNWTQATAIELLLMRYKEALP